MAGRHRALQSPRHAHVRHRQADARTQLVIPGVTLATVLAGGGAAWGLVETGGSTPSGTPITQLLSSATPMSAPSSPLARPAPRARQRGTAHHHHHHHRPPPALALTVHGRASYVEISRGGHLITQRIVHHGHHLTVPSHHLQVVLGDAGAVRMSVDGHRAHRAGRPGEVLRFTVR